MMYAMPQSGSHRPPPPPPPPLHMPPRYPQPTNQYSMPPIPAASPRSERGSDGFLVMDEPATVTTKFGGREWTLEVPQQPVRARMCGFGDKDRRPITPPPCVRLIVRDPLTGQEIDAQDIDISFFVITVDLWDEEAQKEVNLVKHAANSPSISTASAVAYPHTPSINSTSQQQPYFPYQNNTYGSPVSLQQSSQPGNYYPAQTPQGYGAPQPTYSQYSQTQYGFSHSSFGPAGQSNGQYMHTSRQMTPNHAGYVQSHQAQALAAPHQPTGMFTRNLIGALSASAFRLNDQNNKLGVWFILQDLSIRTDGIFRLKFNFVNVGLPGKQGNSQASNDASDQTSPTTPASSHSAGISPNASLNTNSAPVLASVFTKPFQVFSAKKFPGVIESTELSRTFAQQGIKIPIRKDGDGATGAKRRRNVDEDEDEVDDDQ